MASKLGEAYVEITARDTKFRSSMARTKLELRDLRSLAKSAAVAAGTVAVALTAVGVATFRAAADFDSLRRGLDAVTGSSEETARQWERLRKLAQVPGLGFEEAIQGSVSLQAAGLSAELAEGALRGFSNALATVGKGKADLRGVIIALSQIQSKGKVAAQEINQLAERVPQIRKVMQKAFGTSDTENLQKRGIKSEEFITKIVTALSALPQAQGGIQNSMDNLQDGIRQTLAKIGESFAPFIAKLADSLSKFLDSKSFQEGLANFGRWMKQFIADVWPKISAALADMITGFKEMLPYIKAYYEFVNIINLNGFITALKVIGKIMVMLGAVISAVENGITRLVRLFNALLEMLSKAFKLPVPHTLISDLLDASIASIQVWLPYAKQLNDELNKIKGTTTSVGAVTVEVSDDEVQAVLDVVKARRDAAQAALDEQRAAIGFISIRDVGRKAVIAGMQNRVAGNVPELTAKSLPTNAELRSIASDIKAQKALAQDMLRLVHDALAVQVR